MDKLNMEKWKKRVPSLRHNTLCIFLSYLLKSRSSVHSYVEIHGSKVEVFKVGIAKWRHCMTWSPLLLRWFELLKKKERNDLGTFCNPGIPHFWSWIHHLEPVHGLSDKTVGSEIQQTPSEATQK